MNFESSSTRKNYIDELTGIYNRYGFFAASEQLLKEHPLSHFTILYWNIRRFKITNDLFGWESGDKILIHWADSLRELLSGKLAVFARLERDNFICCVEDKIVDEGDWVKLGDVNFHADGIEYHFFSCCGMYRILDPSVPVSVMVDKARVAMESIKNNYLRLYAWYDESMWSSLIEEQRMNSDFKRAILEKQFQVYYQPVCRTSDGLIVGAEALVRWLHPVKGLLSPGIFIPLFEKNGFISLLDRYVWNEVCSSLEERIEQGLDTVPISINVSRIEFYNPNLCDDIRSIVNRHHLTPDQIKIEITESAYSDNPMQVQETVKTFRNYGFQVLMDDFGSGYSSLNILKDLTIDTLKIDMRFLDHFEENKKSAIILEAIIRLAKYLHMRIISEGVETKAEWEYLRSIECDSVQGYYFYRPMPKEDFFSLIDTLAIDRSKLLFTDEDEFDDSILSMFLHTNKKESVLFYSMLGGMGLFEVSGDNVELVRVNKGYYEVVYGSIDKEEMVLNVPAIEPEKSILLENCQTAKKDRRIHRFQLNHRRKDGVFVWLSVKMRYIGSRKNGSLYLFSIENIEERKNAEKNAFLSNVSNAFLDLFDRIYLFNYTEKTAELVHLKDGSDYFEPFRLYSFAEFFRTLAAISEPEDIGSINLFREKEKIDCALLDPQKTTIRLNFRNSVTNELVKCIAFFGKIKLPGKGEQYLCCLKKQPSGSA